MSIFDELKSIADVLRKADKIPEFQLILDIQQKLLELQKENFDLRRQISLLKDDSEFSKKLIFEKDAYYLKLSDGSLEGPYCPKCWGDEKKRLRMQNNFHRSGYNCPNCKTVSR